MQSESTARSQPTIPVPKTDFRYRLVYLIIQDRHVAAQRAEYEASKLVFELAIDNGMTFPTDIPTTNWEWVYYLFLKERFEKEDLTDFEKVYLEGLEEWKDRFVPICPFCGIASMGRMCREQEDRNGIYLVFSSKVRSNSESYHMTVAYFDSAFCGIDVSIKS